MSFYVGKYLIDGDTLEPGHTGAWFMPEAPTQHMAETSNVEELQILPTDMNVVPTQIQFGACTWTDDDGFAPDHEAFDTFYVGGTGFYVRGFAPGTGHYDTFYVGGTGFYVRGFSPAGGHYATFYLGGTEFYVRGFSAGDALYNTFYLGGTGFYVQGFTPQDFFYPIAEDC